jgi:type II secretion system protein H
MHTDTTRNHAAASRRGFTLIEMMVVLAIVAMLAVMVWPAMRKPLAKSELRSAAKQVRTELAKTRLKAIETGEPQQFRFQLGTDRFQVMVVGAGEQPLQATRPASNDAVTGTTEVADGDEFSLPKGVSFLVPEPIDVAEAAEAAGMEAAEETWSRPIIFYPNGRSSDARIELQGQQGMKVEVNLRGLTGVATVGDLEEKRETLR